MINPGEEFFAVVKPGTYSRTQNGCEGAWQKLGPFTATRVTTTYVETKTRRFYFWHFKIEKKAGTDV